MRESLLERMTRIRLTLPPDVKLVAVTKQVAVDVMREAYALGIRDFGESRIQEAEAKQAQLQDLPDITWHMIGHLQNNKAQKALKLFEWIHSIDHLKLAQRLNRLAGELSCQPQVFLQVKILPDPNKYGWHIPELLADLPQLELCKNLKIKGLMVIPPLNLDEKNTLSVFQQARSIAQEIEQQNWKHISMQELSMGMSDDYHLAVQAGSTCVRLGSILFGQRSPQPG